MSRCVSILLLLSMVFCSATAQRQEINLSLNDLKNAKDSFDYTHCEIDLASAYLYVNTDSSLYYSRKALSFAERNKNEVLKAASLLALGEYYSYTNQQILAIEYILDATELYTQQNFKGGLGHCNFSLGELYNIMNQFNKARDCFLKAIEYYKQDDKLQYHLASTYASLGDNYFSQKKYDSSDHYSDTALKIGKQIGKQDILEYAYGTKADVLIAKGKLEEAKYFLRMSKAISEQLGSDYSIAYELIQESKILDAEKKYAEAIVLLDSSISITKFLNMDDVIKDAEWQKYNIYKHAGQYSNALKSLENHELITDTLFGRKKYEEINKVLEKFRLEKKQKQLELLEKETSLNRILIVTLLTITGLLSFLYFFARKKSNERREMLGQLAEKNESIEKQAKHLQHINIVKDRMFSIISHDLRGPVASLKGLIDFMKSGSLTAEESDIVVQELKMSVSGVDMLLENLLIWAQIQIKGEVSIKNETVFIKELVNNIFYISANSAKQKNIQLIEFSDEDITIETDKNKLALIIRNLVNNAIKFTPENGSVTVSTQKLNEKIKICVTDTGIGMSEEEKNKLFNIEKPFTKRGTANEKGSGLGLMFVKEYVQSLGGEFTICSTVGKGSSFCIVI